VSTDYYTLLGVSKQADAAEIKKAFRKKALKLHPDKNPDDPNAEEKFKDLNEAYAVLSDEEKRRQYDRFGKDGFHQRYSTEDIFQGTDFSSVFSDLGFGNSFFGSMFSGGGAQGSPFGGFGADFGRGQRGGARPRSRPGNDLVMREEIGFYKAVMGGEHRVQINHGGQSRSITVRIPAGIKNGQKIRVRGEGEKTQGGRGQPGNLILQVKVSPHPDFYREGSRLFTRVHVPLTTLLLGGTLEVSLLDPPGETKKIRVKAGTTTDTQMRIREAGGPKKEGGRDDLFVVLKPAIPDELTEEQTALLESLRDAGM